MQKNILRGMAGLILLGGAPGSRQLEEELMDESIPIAETPNASNINIVPGNSVKANFIGWADYDTGQRYVAAFDEITENAKPEMKQKYGMARNALQRYILNHEQLELEYQPQNHLEHGTMEAINLEMLEATDSDAYMAGLAHLKRLSNGSRDEKAFYKATSRKYDLETAFKTYGENLDEMVELVSDVISGKPSYQHYTVDTPSYAASNYKPFNVEVVRGE
jgi:hypothetical protein